MRAHRRGERIAERAVRAIGKEAPRAAQHVISREVRARRARIGDERRIGVELARELGDYALRADRGFVRARKRLEPLELRALARIDWRKIAFARIDLIEERGKLDGSPQTPRPITIERNDRVGAAREVYGRHPR